MRMANDQIWKSSHERPDAPSRQSTSGVSWPKPTSVRAAKWERCCGGKGCTTHIWRRGGGEKREGGLGGKSPGGGGTHGPAPGKREGRGQRRRSPPQRH